MPSFLVIGAPRAGVTWIDRYLRQRYYFDHLSRYLELFDKRNLLRLLFDDLKADATAFKRTIYEFLGIDAEFLPGRSENVGNASASKKRNGRSTRLYSCAEPHRGFAWTAGARWKEDEIDYNTKEEPCPQHGN